MEQVAASGICRVCRCTELLGCPEGCWWVDEARTLCSSCQALLETEPETGWTKEGLMTLGEVAGNLRVEVILEFEVSVDELVDTGYSTEYTLARLVGQWAILTTYWALVSTCVRVKQGAAA